jgi:hypothetical protein
MVKSALQRRKEALDEVMAHEHETVMHLASTNPNIQQVSFVRNTVADDRAEYSVSYHVSSRLDTTTSRANACVEGITVEHAGVGQESPWPYAPSVSLADTLRELWSAKPQRRERTKSFARAYVQGHQGVAMLMAGASGCVIGEAVRGLNAISDGALVASAVVGGTWYACTRMVQP